MDLMEARRTLLNNGLTPHGYISDGLILHLDGIDKGNNNAIWKSLIGDFTFDLTDCVFTENGVQFNGSTSNGLWNGAIPLSPANATIEFCAEFEQNDDYTNWTILCPAPVSGSNAIGASLSKTNDITTCSICTGFGSYSNTRWYARTHKMTASANDTRGYVNGTAMDIRANAGSFAANSNQVTAIGIRQRPTTNSMVFKGTMYAIRIYDRILSAAEMIHNERVDNTRFNLGLM